MSEEQQLTGNKVHRTTAQCGVTQQLLLVCVLLCPRRDPERRTPARTNTVTTDVHRMLAHGPSAAVFT